MQRKRAFTLVEMLVVIVIVAILMSALISRLTSYLAKSRDMKRQADLRNIATAIEAYKADHGRVMPTRTMTDYEKTLTYDYRYDHHLFAGHASALYEALKNYINEIPRDPNGKSMIKIHYKVMQYDKWTPSDTIEQLFGKDLKGWSMYKPWEYYYHILLNRPLSTKSSTDMSNVGVLIAKVEIPKIANYVAIREVYDTKGWFRPFGISWITQNGKNFITPTIEIKDIALCSSVEKVKELDSATYHIIDGQLCKYTSEDQLYYILKIE